MSMSTFSNCTVAAPQTQVPRPPTPLYPPSVLYTSRPSGRHRRSTKRLQTCVSHGVSVCNCTGHNYARTTRHLSVGVARQLNYASRVDCIHGRMSCNTSRASLNRKSAGLAASTIMGRRAYEQEVASSACRAQLWASCSHPCVSTRRQTEYYRELHGDGNSGNTAVTPRGRGRSSR